MLARVLSESSGARREGTIVKILERGTQQIVGTYTQSKNFGFVIADDKKLQVISLFPKQQETVQLKAIK